MSAGEVDRTVTTERHLSEDVLDQYVLGHLGEQSSGPVEEHLLVCERCCLELDEVEAYIGVMRGAAERLRKKPSDRFREQLADLAQTLLPAASAPAMIAAGLAIGTFMMLEPHPPVPVTEVALLSVRGIEEGTAGRIRAGNSAIILLNTQTLAASRTFRVEVWSSAGTLVFSTVVHPAGEILRTNPTPPLEKGRYWVRLYDDSGQLLREYGLMTD